LYIIIYLRSFKYPYIIKGFLKKITKFYFLFLTNIMIKIWFYEIIDIILALLGRKFQQNVNENLSLTKYFIIGKGTS